MNKVKQATKRYKHKCRLTAEEKMSIIFDYVLKHLTQRQLGKKYGTSTKTVNWLLKPDKIAKALSTAKLTPSSKKKIAEVNKWLNLNGKQAEADKIVKAIGDPKVEDRTHIEKRSLCEDLLKTHTEAARALADVVKKLIKNLKLTEDTEEISGIGRELRAIFERLAPFNFEVNDILVAAEKGVPQVQNNFQINMATAFAEIMKTDPLLRSILPIRTHDNPSQNEQPTEYESPKERIDFKERAAQPSAGETLLEDNKRDEIEDPPEGDYQANVIDILAGI